MVEPEYLVPEGKALLSKMHEGSREMHKGRVGSNPETRGQIETEAFLLFQLSLAC